MACSPGGGGTFQAAETASTKALRWGLARLFRKSLEVRQVMEVKQIKHGLWTLVRTLAFPLTEMGAIGGMT